MKYKDINALLVLKDISEEIGGVKLKTDPDVRGQTSTEGAPLSLKYVAIKIMECGSHVHPVILQNSFTHTDTGEEIKGIVHRR